MLRAASDNLSALANRIVDVLLDFVDRKLIDQRPLFGSGIEAVADAQRGDRLCQCANEGVVDS